MAEYGFSVQVGVSHYHPALRRSASQLDGLRSDFFPKIFFLFLISDQSQESDTGRCGIIIEDEEPYKCGILLAAVVVALLAWDGREKWGLWGGRQCLQSEKRRVLLESIWFCLVSKVQKVLYCKWIPQHSICWRVELIRQSASQNPMLSQMMANEFPFFISKPCRSTFNYKRLLMTSLSD